MKKIILSIVLVLVILCLSACGGKATDNPQSPSSITADSAVSLPLPTDSLSFSFLSGAGGWRTALTLNKDGSFNGEYSDSELGETGLTHPNGTVYISVFNGNFKSVEKINDYSYKMTLSKLETEKKVNKKWVEDGIQYVASEAYGIDGGKEFILYLPSTPVSELPEEFLSWWPFNYEDEQKQTLSCYGIRNLETEQGFFSE